MIPPRPPVRRILFLPLAAFLGALVIQVALKIAGLPSTSALRVLATPAIAAAIVYLGLRPYPSAGRLRFAGMVGTGLLLVAIITA